MEKDIPFTQPDVFLGPYPSGDTCITINVAAKLGLRCAYIGVAGGDDYGEVVRGRLAGNGVDTSMLSALPGRHTGVVFVAYFSDGTRRFLNTFPDSAGARIAPEDLNLPKIAATKWVHLSGIMLWINESTRATAQTLLRSLPGDVKVSFDPNYRPEVMVSSEVQQIFAPFFERADVLFPSEHEAKLIAGCTRDEEACSRWAAQGKIVVLKQGARGCTVYNGDRVTGVTGFPVKVVDETGCGDSFCAGFLAGLLRELAPERAALLGNAAGALQATARGPMEGAKTYGEAVAFLKEAGIEW